MNKELIKKYKAEFDHWVNSGEVHYTDNGNNWWIAHDTHEWNEIDLKYAIKDKHFEVRKAYALGEEIEIYDYGNGWKSVALDSDFKFIDTRIYRPKSKTKTIVMEEWVYDIRGGSYRIGWFNDEEDCSVCGTPIKKLSERTIEIEE